MANNPGARSYPVALNLLKAGLGFFDSTIPGSLREYLESLLVTADNSLAERGIHIVPGNVADAMLQAMYAEWLYRKKATGEGMPDMLKNEIRTRQVNEAMKDLEMKGLSMEVQL